MALIHDKAIQVQIREGIAAKFETSRPSLELPDFLLEETYFGDINLEDLKNPTVKCIAMGISSSRDRILRNTGAVIKTVPCQVAIQQQVQASDTSYIDRLVLLAEQLQALTEDDDLVSAHPTTGSTFSWSSTEPIRDENDLIYNYDKLFVQNTFQAIFIASYTYILQPS